MSRGLKSLAKTVAILSIFVLLIAMPVLAQSSTRLSIGFEPQSSTVLQGEEFSISIIVKGDLASDIAGADIVLEYDPSILGLVDVKKGELGMTLYKAENGKIHIVSATASGTGKNSVVVAKLVFRALKAGKTEIRITKAELADSKAHLVAPTSIDSCTVMVKASSLSKPSTSTRTSIAKHANTPSLSPVTTTTTIIITEKVVETLVKRFTITKTVISTVSTRGVIEIAFGSTGMILTSLLITILVLLVIAIILLAIVLKRR